MQAKSNGILRNTNSQRTPSYTFLLLLLPFPVLAETYTDSDDDDIEGKRSWSKRIVPFP